MKLIIDLKRVPCKKEWSCPFCHKSTKGDIYTLSKKTKDGGVFERVMCVDCINNHLFRKI